MERENFEQRGLDRDWTPEKYIGSCRDKIIKIVKDRKALCALSGGVDSSVSAALVHKAIGNNLICVFVDHGLMRKNEPEEIAAVMEKQLGINLIMVNAKNRFLKKLKGISDPERKRKIIGEEFIRVFEEEASKLGKIDYLVQGTIYPDIIESKNGAVKAHHNVGGLPEKMNFKLLEPVKMLFKDEVRQVGRALGLPSSQIDRQPFPGPGLGVRIIGEITEEKLYCVREADAILREEIKDAELDKKIWQYFAVCPGILSTGVKEGRRTYGQTIVLRAIHSKDAMSAEIAELPYSLLRKTAARITAEVKNVNRVCYDITDKPPATIEWE